MIDKSNKHFGIYDGKVKSIGDKPEIGRIKATVPTIFGNHSSVCNWAYPSPAMAGAGNGYGFFALPQINDTVYIQFINGDIDKPVWSPGPWHVVGGESGAPKHARGERDECDAGMKGAHGIPKTSFKGEYGKVYVWQTPGGNMIEMDDTVGYERIQIYHSSGSHYEIHADGTVVDASTADRVEVTTQNKQETVLGNSKRSVQGNLEDFIQGDYHQTILGNAKFVWKGEQEYEIGKLQFKTGGDQRFVSGGNLYQYADANMNVEVGGSRAVKVTSADSKFVMGPHTTMVTNVEGLPTSDSLLLHGLNGVTSLIGTDASGLASGGYVRIETVPPNLKMYAGPAPDPSLQIAGEGRPSQGSGLVLDGTGAGTILHSMLNLLLKGMVSIILEAPSVRIGGRAAIHPLLWGEIAASLFDSHVHTTAMGPSGIPIAPVMGATALSKTVTTT